MVGGMAKRRGIFYLGVAGVLFAVDLMQPPLLISITLLLASLFLIAWAIVPDKIRHWAGNTGGASPYIHSGLDGMDNLLGHVVADSSEKKECMDRLAEKMGGVSRLLNRRVTNDEELQVWKSDYGSWINEVASEIENNFGKPQAMTFRAVISVDAAEMQPYFNDWHNQKKLRLNKRIENLRTFINANSNFQT